MSKYMLKGINLSDIDAFQLLPEGSYTVRVDEVEILKGKTSGKDYINTTFAVINSGYKHQKIFQNITLQAHALFRLKSFLSAIKYPITQGLMNVDLKVTLGRFLQVDTVHEEFMSLQGERVKRSIITNMYPVDEKAKEEPEEKLTHELVSNVFDDILDDTEDEYMDFSEDEFDFDDVEEIVEETEEPEEEEDTEEVIEDAEETEEEIEEIVEETPLEETLPTTILELRELARAKGLVVKKSDTKKDLVTKIKDIK